MKGCRAQRIVTRMGENPDQQHTKTLRMKFMVLFYERMGQSASYPTRLIIKGGEIIKK